jgi:NAD(P)-dependent dehydrogenase (short-subunit alcohol dehydrogenase family)
MVSYNCAKAGIEALTRTLALEGKDCGIRVNAVAAGRLHTREDCARRQKIAQEVIVHFAIPIVEALLDWLKGTCQVHQDVDAGRVRRC